MLSLWEDKLGKGIPSCGLTAATQAKRFGNCEPLCSAQPLQLYWDALHEALLELGPFQAPIVSPSMSLIIFKPHCSFWFYSQICQALSCLWPLPILFSLPGTLPLKQSKSLPLASVKCLFKLPQCFPSDPEGLPLLILLLSFFPEICFSS